MTWSRGTNSRLPFAVNVSLNFSIVAVSRHSFEMKYGIFNPVKSKGDEILRQQKRVSTQHRILRQVSSPAYHLFFFLS